MTLKRTHKIADNRGMTLIEVLVAVAIFGIIVGPICFAFVTTVHVNNASRQIEEATAAGNNIMEELRELSLLDLEDIISTDDILPGETYASTAATILKRPYDIKVADDGIYILTSREKINNRDYVVRLTLSPVIVPDATKLSYTDYNDRELAKLFSMSQGLDGAISVGETLDLDTAGSFSGNVNEIYMDMRRTITVDISDEDTVSVTVEYEYKWDKETPVFNQPIYSNDDDEIELRNLFVFFNPLYSGKDKEKIIINNPNSVPVNVYLIRMAEENAINDLRYGVDVEINDPASDYATAIKTNLSEDVLQLDSLAAAKLIVQDLASTEKSNVAYDVTAGVYLLEDVTEPSGDIDESQMTVENRQATIEGSKEKN